MAVQKYRVLAGKHSERVDPTQFDASDPAHYQEGSGLKTYKAGDVVESEKPLDMIFQGKFKKVQDEKPADVSPERRAQTDMLIESGEWDESDRDFLQQAPQTNFDKLRRRAMAKSQSGVQAGTKNPLPGEVPPPLKPSQRDKGSYSPTEVNDQPGKPGEASPLGETGTAAGDETPKAREKVKSALGDDVTDDHEIAQAAGLLVFKRKDGKLGVATQEHPGKMLNKQPLADADAVEKFVDDYSKD